MKKIIVSLAACSAVLVGVSAHAGNSPGMLNEIAVPICAPNWAIVGVVVPLAPTNVKCPSSQNGR